jgi:serine O-acetyltransferase
MTFAEYRYLVLADLYRYERRCDLRTLLRQLCHGESYKYVFWMRTANYCRRHPVLKFMAYPLVKAIWKHYRYKFGIGIPFDCPIGPGLYIGHFGAIFVSPGAVLGRNINLSPGVTIGKINRGRLQGYPKIGNDVFIGPGAKVIGAVKVGSQVVISPNCVVAGDLADRSVVVGIPAMVVSRAGSEGDVQNTDYEELLGPWPGRSGENQQGEPS